MQLFDTWVEYMAQNIIGTVIFDIDDTLLDYKSQKIIPVINAFKKCCKYGFPVGIVTARKEEHRKVTIEELKYHGIAHIDDVHAPITCRCRL